MTEKMKSFLEKKITRKSFLRSLAGLATGAALAEMFPWFGQVFGAPAESTGRIKKNISGNYDLVVAKGNDPYDQTLKAIAAMGGMEKFVAKDSVVLIKPNMAWDRSPEQAANTNPEVVAALIDLAFGAGARRVNVFDNSCNEGRRCYANSGIEAIARKHKANVFFPSEWNILQAKFSGKSQMESWPVYREALECDTFINVPILKHHGLTRLTLSMKNLMGVCAGSRGKIHFNIGEKLVDLTGFINPDLTVIDAVRVLTDHGPQGGSLEDVVNMGTIIVGTDPTLSDVFACKLMEVDPDDVPYLKQARERGFGNMALDKANILHLQV